MRNEQPNEHRKKTYLIVEERYWKTFFKTPEGNVRWYRAGGSQTKPKYIIESLVKLYGATEWAEIYDKFMKALYAVKTINPVFWQTWAIVVYEGNDTDHDE